MQPGIPHVLLIQPCILKGCEKTWMIHDFFVRVTKVKYTFSEVPSTCMYHCSIADIYIELKNSIHPIYLKINNLIFLFTHIFNSMYLQMDCES